MNKILLSALFATLSVLINSTLTRGAKVSEDSARIVAQNFYWEFAYDIVENLDFKKIVAELVHTESRSGINLYYIFNIPSFHGYVIVTADNRLKPVIGCNTNQIYERNSPKPPAYEYWMRERAESIYALVSDPTRSDKKADIHPTWYRFLEINRLIQPRTTIVGPLLTTCWHQGCGFNANCPEDESADDYCDHCLVGCTATAMAQIMKYWNYPGRGNGYYGYYSDYGIEYANFGNTTYYWAEMPQYSSNEFVAELGYHCGVSVDMDYGPEGSGAYDEDARDAYVEYFGYNPSAELEYRTFISDDTWNNLIQNELNATPPRPVQYGGHTQMFLGTAHSWVIDGYVDLDGYITYHFAWGTISDTPCEDDGYWTLEDNPYFDYHHTAIIGLNPLILNAPGNVSATDGTSTAKITISWADVPYASHYIVLRSTDSEVLGYPISDLITETNYEDNSCTHGVTYYYRIIAATSSEGDNNSDPSSSNDGWRKLSPPANVAASDGTHSDYIYISWPSISGGNYYLIYRNTTNDSETATALGSWQADLNYTDNTAIAGQVYYYWVKAAVSSSGDRPSDFSTSNAGYTQYSGCFVEVQVPDGGESWTAGSSHNITWTDNISGNVKIELFKEDQYNSMVIESTESSGSYSWTIPIDQIPGNDYQIKITSIDASSCFTMSAIFSITGPILLTCGNPIQDIRDGQIYSTVLIGNQCWMAENLNLGSLTYSHYDQTDNNIIEKYCYENYNYSCSIYGGLYQWDEAMQYTTTTGVQGICPAGWHIPRDIEWKILEGTVDSHYGVGDPIWNICDASRGFDVGGKLKSTGTVEDENGFWFAPNQGATNSSGFTALPGGLRIDDYSGSFGDMHYRGSFWSSSSYFSSGSWIIVRGFSHSESDAHRWTTTSTGNYLGYSIRCINDDATGLNIPCPGIPTVMYEGQIYSTILIGSQCWLKENLNVGTMITVNYGEHLQTDNDIIEKYCYDNNTANCITYGGLYEWNEAMQYSTTEEVQGICPAGWHIPSDSDWNELHDFLEEPYEGVGGILKSVGTLEEGTGLWHTPNYYASNAVGFAGLPGGCRQPTFIRLGLETNFWSSSQEDQDNAWFRGLHNNDDYLYATSWSKQYGHSIRCIKNTESGDTTLINGIIGDGEEKCYQASNTITVAGSGTTYIIQDGGELTLVAGNKILLKPGFHAEPGSYVHAYIGDQGCEEPLKPANIFSAEQDQLEETIIEQALGIDETTSTEYLKVYPNPTTGKLNIEINSQDSDELNTIWVYDFHGRLIQQQVMIGPGKTELDLSTHPIGMYLIRVIHGNKSETVKVVKQN